MEYDLQKARVNLIRFANGKQQTIGDSPPSATTKLNTRSVLDALYKRLGNTFLEAINAKQSISSPKVDQIDGKWLQSSNIVGINLRTCKGLMGALKFVLTLPKHIDAIHLLPIFEPGVVGSLYGMASWHINEEFFDVSWAQHIPQLDDTGKQLKAFVNICHALGYTVGIDVIPHTDRFSEIVLCNPHHFEWIQRTDTAIVDHSENLHEAVQRLICQYATGRMDDYAHKAFFDRSEFDIRGQLFGHGSFHERNERRDKLIQYLYEHGYETLPATMAPPYRGLSLDLSDEALTIDDKGRKWRDFKFDKPEAMSRAFGPLARYKIWERKNNNKNWEVDHDKARLQTFDYVAERYFQIVDAFGFDFMRGDMSHVQMREAGVPKGISEPYDLLRYVKRKCQSKYPYFGYFAESFLTADNYMTYGSEKEHLIKSEADVALGNLQNYSPNSEEFTSILGEYDQLLLSQNTFKPAFTVFTADKDDPRFDSFFLTGNIARYFFAVLCNKFPSYSSLGFRQRDPHPTAFANEYYSKYFVFTYSSGPKARKGPYQWGMNYDLWTAIKSIDNFRLSIEAELDFDRAKSEWKSAPVAGQHYISWTVGTYEFHVNFGNKAIEILRSKQANCCFETGQAVYNPAQELLNANAGVVFTKQKK